MTVTIDKPTTFAEVVTNDRHEDVSAAQLIISLVSLSVYLENHIKELTRLELPMVEDLKQELKNCNDQMKALRGR